MAKHKVDIVVKARDQASKKFGKIGKSAKGMGSMLRKAAAVGAAYFGTRALFGFAKESIALFNTQELAVRHLTDALGNLGAGSKEQVTEMQKFASEIQKVTTVGDEATMEIMALGASMGGLAGKDLKAATIAAIGFSRSLGMDTKAAMTLIAKAAQGNTAAFGRYGITFEKGMTQQQKFQEIMAKGADGFKIAQGETETFGGKVQQLSNTWGDFKETIGEALANYLPGLGAMMESVGFAVSNFDDIIKIAKLEFDLFLVSSAESAKHVFVDVIPAYIKYFAQTVVDNFKSMWSFVSHVIWNIGDSVKNLAVSIYNWFAGEGWSYTFTPLLEGWKQTWTELPKIAKAAMSETEYLIAEQISKARSDLAGKKEGGSRFNAGDVVAAAGGGVKKVSGSGIAAGTSGSVAAVESRFLHHTATKKNPVDTSNKLLAGILKVMEDNKKFQSKFAKGYHQLSDKQLQYAANFA